MKGVHEYYSMETQKNWFFFSKKIEIKFWLVPKSWNHFNFANISPTLVFLINTSMERSSRVLQHRNPKVLFFFQKNLKLNFDLCQRAEIVQVGLNINLYDDIGDASSSLRRSTSIFFIFFFFFATIDYFETVHV